MTSRLRNGTLIAIALLILPAAIVYWVESIGEHRHDPDPMGAQPPPAATAPEHATAPASEAESSPLPPEASDSTTSPRPDRPQPVVIRSPDPGRSPLADRLNAPEGDIGQDLAIVGRVLENFRLELGENPYGNNREITAQLSGRNAHRHAPLPRDHPAISPAGELLDRWGTPFFFHALSARQMEIRSAGPDRELYTADDVVSSPVPPPP